MTYTVHVNVACEVSSLKEAKDTMERLVLSVPEGFQVMSFSVWSPADGMARPAATAAATQAITHEQFLAELQQIARAVEPAEPLPPKRRRH